MKKKKSSYGYVIPLFYGLLFIVGGIFMIAKNRVAFGINSRTLSLSGFGGHLLILIGCIFLVVAYYSLSPFSKTRKFFEGGLGKEKSKKKNSNK
jgi:hypothetical protein